MDRRKIFNEIIRDYEIARPGYPIELYNDIVEFSMLKPDSKILEIGSGPGQATEYFVKGGYAITGLEIGANQVQYLLEKYSKYPNFSSICSSFEEYNCLSETYNMIFSATAFHWIEPELGYPKAYNLLKKNGTLAVFWHMSSIIEHQTDMLKEIEKIYQKYAPELDSVFSMEEAEEMHELRLSQIQTNNLFTKPQFRIYKWNDEYTTEKYIKLLNTYSDIHVLDNAARDAVLKNVAELIDSNNGKIIVPQEVRLYMARK